MKTNKRILLLTTGLAAAAAIAAYAGVVTSQTYRTTGFFIGLTQGANPVTGHPRYEDVDFAGHNLVNLAMGRGVTDTNFPKQVMAMTFECDLSAASLVVYDEATSNVVATIAASTTINTVKQQDTNQKAPNRAHFVTVMQVGQNGNETNGLAGGYFTVAGRVNLNTTTGCPEPVLVMLDRDPLDRLVDDIELPNSDDPDATPLFVRTGLAHLIGVVDAVTEGTTNTVLLPYGGLSIRRDLSTPASAPASN
jgi:hypothetical protein